MRRRSKLYTTQARREFISFEDTQLPGAVGLQCITGKSINVKATSSSKEFKKSHHILIKKIIIRKLAL
jgi:hypothetical protein